MKLQGWRARLAIALAYPLLELWARTLRFELDDRAGFVDLRLDQNVIGLLWHNRLFLLPHVTRKYVPKRRAVALISASRDGEFLADLVARFGVEAVRGSSSRKGATAILQLADKIRAGMDVAITPDGPRGPAYELGAGTILLAQKSQTPVLFMHMEYSSCWRLKSWDHFILPKPFSTVRVIYSGLHHISQTSTDSEFEAERLRLQNAMMDLVERR